MYCVYTELKDTVKKDFSMTFLAILLYMCYRAHSSREYIKNKSLKAVAIIN